ncbi:MAG: phosphopantothenoylcysteine decarboxylase [Thermodesulfobacteriota bacterium]|nr:MAG: phosphopantothenoylcysteine decarboxylase [Thermodesulfobacteriota bacterium]
MSKEFEGKKILIGVCGSAKLYKTCSLIEALREKKARVTPILTSGGEKFATPLLFTAVSKNKCFTNKDFFDHNFTVPQNKETFTPLHIYLAKYADIIIVAPATASFISKLAHGEASELLIAVIVASKAPVCIFPSMNINMWENPITQENVKKLKNYGYYIYEPTEEEIAKGIQKGKMPGIDKILEVIKKYL